MPRRWRSSSSGRGRKGREILLVSSGAVAAGRTPAGWQSGPGAAAGALRWGRTSRGVLAALTGLLTAQVLLCHDDMHAIAAVISMPAPALREAARRDALPVINENDTVAVDELRLGDNDNLAAAVASLVDADLLLIASDVEGLYSANPQSDPAAACSSCYAR
ncbi:MAG: hypothetical protein H7A20_10615 [Rhodanobacteraceae bacterium]|nr:hypothetical protein [Rhodanobacteraceae bacterium]